MVASWNGTEIARSRSTVVVEGNHYFPPEDVDWSHLVPSSHTSRCWWKGVASYWSVSVGDAVARDAAWCYEDPLPEASHVRGHVAFWRGVRVEVVR